MRVYNSDMEIFMNCSMPRAGSTLLQNILAQNPDFYCTPTSGIMDFMVDVRRNFTTNPAIQAQDEDEMKKAFQSFCKKGLYGYFEALTDKKYVVDKNREWCSFFNFAKFILEKPPKMIGMVRHLPQVFASLELKYRNTSHKDSGVVERESFVNTTTEKRAEFFAGTRPLGTALERMYEVTMQGLHKEMLFIRYEDLCMYPREIMEEVYAYLEIPSYEHNFSFIEQLTNENDTFHGILADHKIRPMLEYTDNNPVEILGQSTIAWIQNQYKWYYEVFGYNM